MQLQKKILVVSHFMHIGGAERALLGLLESIDYKRYEVDLFLFRQEGELFDYIPKNVNLLPPIAEYTLLACPIKDIIGKHPIVAIARIIGKIKASIYKRMNHHGSNSQVEIEYSHKYTKMFMPMISQTEYDLAISFLTPHYFVSEKVCAHKKAAWIHTDYTSIRIDNRSELKMWSPYNYIVSISDMCTEAFVKIFPSLSQKIIKIENPLPTELIIQQSNTKVDDMHRDSADQILLLSIGRFSVQKNFENIPQICRMIRSYGLDVKWFIIGYGSDECLIRESIQREGMDRYVIILGKKSNPYPYIKKCDWYIQPSRYEGKAVTVREAQILHKPVIITNYATAGSQLHDGIDGIIVPLDNSGCAERIASIISNEELKELLVYNTSHGEYSGREDIYKIDLMLGE